jgi:hypothetical protein
MRAATTTVTGCTQVASNAARGEGRSVGEALAPTDDATERSNSASISSDPDGPDVTSAPAPGSMATRAA